MSVLFRRLHDSVGDKSCGWRPGDFGILVKPGVDIVAPWRKGYTSGLATSVADNDS